MTVCTPQSHTVMGGKQECLEVTHADIMQTPGKKKGSPISSVECDTAWQTQTVFVPVISDAFTTTKDR